MNAAKHKTTFASRLLEAREKAKLTQGQLAKRVGMTQAQISKLERGDRSESTKTAQIARECRVNAYWLATGEGDSDLALPPMDGLQTVAVDPAKEILLRIFGSFKPEQQAKVMEAMREIERKNLEGAPVQKRNPHLDRMVAEAVAHHEHMEEVRKRPRT